MAITETIILNGDASGAQTATKSLKKDISSLKDELDTLDKGTEDYNITQQKLIDKMKEQTARNNELKKAVGSGGLKAEIRMLRNELGSLTEGTAEYNNVFAKLSAKMLEQKELSAKLKTSSKDFGDMVGNTATTLGGLTGTFGAVNAVMGLFGNESEEIQKAMLKVQQVMALTQGLQGIDDAIKAWGRLKGNIQAYVGTAETAKNVNSTLAASNIEAATSEAPIATGAGAVSAAQIKKGVDGVQADKDIITQNGLTAESEQLLATKTREARETIDRLNKSIASNQKNMDIASNRQGSARFINSKKALEENRKKLEEAKTAQDALNTSEEVGAVASGKFANGLKAIGKATIWMVALSAVLWAVTKAWDAITKSGKKQEEEVNKQIEKNKELSDSIGDTASKNVASFNEMKKQWESLGNNTKKQKQFIKDYKDELKVLFGDGKITLKEYGDLFGKFSNKVIEGYMLQAKAAAYMSAYQKAIAKEVSLELQTITYNTADWWDTMIEMFKNPTLKEADIRKKVTEKNRQEAKTKRAKEIADAKADAKRMLEQADKNAEAAEKQFKALGLNMHNSAKTGNNATIKSFKDLNEEFIKFQDQNSKIRLDWITEEELKNEQYYENLKRTQADNYNVMFLGTKKYLEMKQALNDAKASEELDKANSDALKLKETQTKILDNNIKGIDENLKKATGLSIKERNKQIALKTSYENERSQLTDNYNTTILNNTAKYNTAIANDEKQNYQERQTNLANFYQAQINENERALNIINLDTQKALEDLKINENKKKGTSLLKLLFGLDGQTRDERIKEMELQIKNEKDALEKGLKDEEVLRAKITDPNTSIEERKKAEDELTKLMEENSKKRVQISSDEAKLLTDNQKDITDAIYGGMEAASGVLSALNEVYQSELDNTLSGLNSDLEKNKADLQSRYDQGLVSKEDYDKQMVNLENNYNDEVYKQQVKAAEKQKKIQIFQTIIETLEASIKAFSSVANTPFIGTALGIAAAASTMAMGYAKVRAIEAQRIEAPSKSSLATSSATSAISSGSLTYQSANLTSSNQALLNQQQQNNQQPIFVSVVDIENVQKKVKVVENQSTF